MTEEIQVPLRVLALAEQIKDAPIAWKEHDDGSITIVFCNKGKRKFEKIEEVEEVLTVVTTKAETATPPVIHTNAEAQEAVKTLTPKHQPRPKKKE